MPPAPGPTPFRMLTRLFLRQFLANDLIAPDADRSQLLAVVTAALVSLTLFISVIKSAVYVGPFVTPGLAALNALDDKYFYLAAAMLAAALVALAQWDALAIDGRDAAILEVLPIRASAMRRAKLAAVALIGLATALLVNAWPTLIFPSFLIYTFRAADLSDLLRLMGVHALIGISAALVGYGAIVALREVALAVLGVRLFGRVSPWVQGLAIVILGSSLLLMPTAAHHVGERGLDGPLSASPPMWFVGAYEVLAGDVIADLPRATVRARQRPVDARATALYEERGTMFPSLAARAALAPCATVIVWALAYLWNARRRQDVTVPPLSRGRAVWYRRAVGRTVDRLLLRDGVVRAGFHFTMAAMWRSPIHRLMLASAAAVGVALALAVAVHTTASAWRVSPLRFSIQPLLAGALLVGFRHAIRVPAELRANWGVEVAWPDERRAFVTGAKRAALLALATPVVLAVLPIEALSIGIREALLHAALGLGCAMLLLEIMLVGYDKVPFTCSYLPRESMKALIPVYAAAFVVYASMAGDIGYQGLDVVTPWLAVPAALVYLRWKDAHRPAGLPLDFNEAPRPFERLGLDA